MYTKTLALSQHKTNIEWNIKCCEIYNFPQENTQFQLSKETARDLVVFVTYVRLHNTTCFLSTETM